MLEPRAMKVARVVPRGERVSNDPDLLDNLQAWYENNYDTRLLHSNLAFPLLKKLTDIGDPNAKQVFKEEIAKRLIASVSRGFYSIIYYFYREGYISYLTREEFWSVFGSDGQVLYEIEKQVRKYEIINNKKIYKEQLEEFEYFKIQKELYIESGPLVFIFEEGRVTSLCIYGDKNYIAEENHDLYYENISYLELKKLPKSIGKLDALKELFLMDLGLITLPKTIEKLKKLEKIIYK